MNSNILEQRVDFPEDLGPVIIDPKGGVGHCVFRESYIAPGIRADSTSVTIACAVAFVFKRDFNVILGLF